MCFVASIFAHILRLISKSLPFSLKSTFAFIIYPKKHLSTPKTGFKKIQPNRNMTKARRRYRFPGKQQCNDIKADIDQTRFSLAILVGVTRGARASRSTKL